MVISKHDAKVERARRVMRERYRRDPLLWLEECMGEPRTNFMWSEFGQQYENHKWDGTIDPLAQSWIDVANQKWVGVEAATGTSKTYWLSRVCLWFLDVYEDSLIVTTAPKQDQLKLNLWAEMTKVFHKFKKFRPHSEMMNLRLVADSRRGNADEADVSKSHQAIGFVAGSGSEEDSATRAQGFHRKNMLIVLEETPGIGQPLITAFQNTCTGSNNIMLAVGNPDHKLDALHKFCTQETVKHYRISALDYPNVVLQHELFPGAVSQGSIDRRTVQYGKTSKLYMSRIRGISPAQQADSLVKYDWIASCCLFKPEYEEHEEIKTNEWDYNACGIDVANSEEGDKAAIAWGQKNALTEIHEFQCKNANDLALNVIKSDMWLNANDKEIYNTSKVQDLRVDQDRIGVDAVGVGVATINTFKANHYDVVGLQGGYDVDCVPIDEATGEPMYKFQSLRAQMYFQFARDCQDRNFIVAINDQSILNQLIDEATTPKLVLSANSVAVESKEHIKKRLGRSPNMLDSVVYWNWMRRDRKDTGVGGLAFK